ncbi:MAG: type I methionyl aminopeptidase [Clostridia bacterium]|nr:type I methionyl aminopeptidase [Clostridia bacterium]
MTNILSKSQIEKMHDAGKIVALCHEKLRDFIKPGITTREIDRFVESLILKHKAIPEQKGYTGYPFATCTSVNDEICHAFPSSYVIKDGDLLKVDFVVNLNGWLGDSAWCYAVGNLSPKAKLLMDTTRECLYLGIEQAKVGHRVGDIGAAIQAHAEARGFSVVREYTGHGISREMHDGLIIPHYGTAGKGPRIKEGMVFTIEPMINEGRFHYKLDDDGWTARTLDGSLSAQFEHTIAITKEGNTILTKQGE